MDFNDIYLDILAIVSEYGEVPGSSVESERFFSNQLEQFEGNRQDAIDYVRKSAPGWFQSVSGPPQWIQAEQWQYANDEPMVYMGHIDVPASLEFFHDAARIFVFMDSRTSEVSTVFQIS